MSAKLFAASCVLVGNLLAGPALAADSVSASFDISLGGARVMKASYGASMANGKYQAQLDAKTVGMSKLFSKIKLNLAANGAVEDGDIRPVSYNYHRKKNDKTKQRALSFNAAGKLKTDGTDYEPDILKAVAKGVLDPLSMLIKISASDAPCSGKHRAFDGRDVFDISLSGAKGGNGKALTCTITYKPIAGGDVAEGDTEAKQYQITLAPLGVGQGYFPVRITGTSKGAPFEVNATGVTVDGAPLSY